MKSNYRIIHSILLLIMGFFIVLSTKSCYTFNGITIPDNVETYYIEQFKLKANNAPPLIDITFTEALKNKINQQTKLVANNNTPDIEFRGEISSFILRALAPTRDQESSLNRIELSIQVEYINNKDEEANWSQRFSGNYDFDATEELLSVQDLAISEIYEQIIEQIFNKAFANW